MNRDAVDQILIAHLDLSEVQKFISAREEVRAIDVDSHWAELISLCPLHAIAAMAAAREVRAMLPPAPDEYETEPVTIRIERVSPYATTLICEAA